MSKSKSFTIVTQMLGCILFMSFPLLFLNNAPNEKPLFLFGSLNYWIFCFSFIALYYFNTYYLIPSFLVNKRYTAYITILIALSIGFYLLKPFDRLMREDSPPLPHRHDPPPPKGHRIDMITVYIFIMIIALSIASKMIRFWINTERRVAQIEADKVLAELAFLKAQVHPHFLFNTLNNIYTLAVTHHEKTAESILRLSQMMRYFMEEPQQKFVSLKQEADCINDYIALQRLRWGKNCTLHVHMENIDDRNQIAPLLLMGFIENTFKYGVSKQYPSYIKIELMVSGERIRFYSENSIHPHIAGSNDTGIGLSNTKKRLEQLYPNGYILEINQCDQRFKVELLLNT